jgi:hypothetical protein
MLKQIDSSLQEIRKDVRRIRGDVDLIRTGPFHSAREYLEIAIRRASDGADYVHYLQKAEDQFIQALGLCASMEESSVVQYNLGVVAAARGDRHEACHRLKQAYIYSVKLVNELGRGSYGVYMNDSLVWADQTRRFTSALAIGYWPKTHVFTGEDREATAALKAYIHFADAIASAYKAIDPTATVSGPRLRELTLDEKAYRLEWTQIPSGTA